MVKVLGRRIELWISYISMRGGKKNDISKKHMNNVMSLSMLGKVNIQNKLNSQYQQAIDNHNEKVKNRHVLNLIINCIRFCSALELAL
ncbi:hypothetical protein C0J52_13042 [Blattella germanica]|nr:hypothetical protein C0J52_13042 [Blattella germanica]